MSFRASSQIVGEHSDNRPFVTHKPNPPTPGGRWPGDTPKPAKIRGPVIELVRENLDTHEKRFAAMMSLLDSGYMAPNNLSREAEGIVAKAWEYIQGADLSEPDKYSLVKHDEGIAAHNEAYRKEVAAYLLAERVKKLRARRVEAATGLTRRQDALNVAVAFINNAPATLEALFWGQDPDAVPRFGPKLAGARELATLLRKVHIPSQEKVVAALDDEIAACL